MKNKRKLDAIGLVNDDYLAESIPRKQIGKGRNWIKWCTMAACFALIVTISIESRYRIINCIE